MMQPADQLEAAVQALLRLGVEVREVPLGGAGGGLCTVRGKQVVLIDVDADLATRLNRCLLALGSLPAAESAYLLPALREAIGRAQSSST